MAIGIPKDYFSKLSIEDIRVLTACGIPLNIKEILDMDEQKWYDLIHADHEELSGYDHNIWLKLSYEIANGINEIRHNRNDLWSTLEEEAKHNQWYDNNDNSGSESGNVDEDGEEDEPVTVKDATEYIINQHSFVTLKDNEAICVYKDGVYTNDGEIVINQELESLYDYGLNRSKRAEIREHIRYKQCRSIEEFDADPNIINLSNGLYDIKTGEFRPHTPDYLSLNQKPIIYDKNAPIPTRFVEFIKQVLYPSDIRTMLELMAYAFWRDNPFEILTILSGDGSNGKSVLIGVLAALLGDSNVSNVSLKTLIERPFGLYDLVGKDVNVDSEMSSSMITESAIVKKITGRQLTRVEQKNQKAFDVRLHAKLWFSANSIPETTDNTDAFHRRVRIVSFPNKFESGTPGFDPDLISKLTTPESLSGIFNLLMPMVRRVLKNKCIYMPDKTIEALRQKYEKAVNPVRAFLDIANAEDAEASEAISKDHLYTAFEYFLKKYRLALMPKTTFGRKLAKEGIQSYREPGGSRRYMWQGIRLKTEYYNAVFGFYDRQRSLTDLV